MADATTGITQDTANLHLDEVTGEKVSKSELKKRQKQRENEKKKAEKAAAAPARPEKKTATNSEVDESNLNPNVRVIGLYVTCADHCSNISKSEVAVSITFVEPSNPIHILTSSKSTPMFASSSKHMSTTSLVRTIRKLRSELQDESTPSEHRAQSWSSTISEQMASRYRLCVSLRKQQQV